jgi:hypothetical protein
MEVSKALSQISEIHGYLAKGEVYRGLRSLPVALSGVCGVLAATLQRDAIAAEDPLGLVVFWLAAALGSGLVGSSEILFNYSFRDDAFARRRTQKVVGQFVPCLVAGGAVTVGLTTVDTTLVSLLPGLWAILFGLGIFAARPYLPRASGWVALYYLAAGSGLILLVPRNAALFGWAIGATFGVGQLAAALVLYWNLERTDHV